MSSPPVHSGSTSLSPGDKLDKFEVVSQIGAGAMSVVWKGHDRLLGRDVAIKQLFVDQNGDDEALRERFRAEAHLQRRLSENQEHLVKIIDFIDEPRGMFIVMEYVDGQSLEQVLAADGSPMDQRKALGIVAAAAMGLAAIHERDVIHRDLKPSNILLPKAGGLKVCDFGIASLIDDQEALSVGSVRYMAPELFTGDEADGRADIYALGMIAYEMLAGRAKFTEAFKIVLRDQRNQALRWMKWHTNQRSKAPPLSSLVPDVPPTLDELIGRMMEKEPARRVGSARDLLEAIRRHFSGQAAAEPAREATAPAAAVGVDTTAPTAALPKRSKLPIILAAVLGVQVLIAGGWLLISQQGAHQQQEKVRDAAVADYDSARALMQDANFADALPIFERLAAQWPDDPAIGQESQLRVLWCQANLALIADRTADARVALDALQARNPRWGNIVPEFRRKLDKREAFLKEVARIEAHIDAGEFDQARLKLREQQQVVLTQEEEQAFRELATRLEGQIAQSRVRQTIDRARQLAGEDRLSEAVTLLRIARQRMSSGELDDAYRELGNQLAYSQVLAEAEQARRDDALDKAIAAYEKALKIRRDPDVAQALRHVRSEQAYRQGLALEKEGQYSQAAEAYTRALGLNEQNQQVREALERLKVADQRDAFLAAGERALGSGDYEQAVAQFALALKLADDPAIQQRHREAQIQLKNEQGKRALATGEIDRARTLFNEVLELSPGQAQATQGLADIERWSQYIQFIKSGDAFRKQSRYREAKRDYRKAREVLPTEAVEQRLSDVEFESLVAAAKADMEAGNWSSARNWLLVAAKLRQTEEVEQLLAEVDRRDPLPPSLEDEASDE